MEAAFNDAITDILKDIARRVTLNKKAMTSMAQYQIMKLEQIMTNSAYEFIRIAVNQNAEACQLEVMDELDVNLVETSAHFDARSAHAEWQGRVF